MNATNAVHANGAEPVADPPKEFPPLRFTAHPVDGDSIERFLASSSSLWKKQRDRLEAMEAIFAAERFRQVEAFQRRMQALSNEATDALRELDRKHAKEVAEAQRMLAALAQLRDS